jgi:hypothetical protein
VNKDKLNSILREEKYSLKDAVNNNIGQKLKYKNERKPKMREAYGSFSPQREYKSSSVPRSVTQNNPSSLNISRVASSTSKSPFENDKLKKAFKELTKEIDQK